MTYAKDNKLLYFILSFGILSSKIFHNFCDNLKFMMPILSDKIKFKG